MSVRPEALDTDAEEMLRARALLRQKRILIIGGTGSLGQELLSFLHESNDLVIFSRDEEKQWRTKHQYPAAHIRCVVGDIRDIDSVVAALRTYRPQVVINAAALKQITTCEYHPYESVKTNVLGVQNLINAVLHAGQGVETVVGISTDKACQPINVYGMGKAIQERMYVEANLHTESTRFVCVRYGNVLESRGSVIPLFKSQIAKGGPVTITLPHMTRFLLSLRQSVQLILTAYEFGLPGDLWIPKAVSATVGDLAHVLIQGRSIPVVETGIRPGEKIHEALIAEEEVLRTIEYRDHYVIEPILPELRSRRAAGREGESRPVAFTRYASDGSVLSREALHALLTQHGVMHANG